MYMCVYADDVKNVCIRYINIGINKYTTFLYGWIGILLV